MSKGVNLIIVTCEEGDWEGIYIDGECVVQGHSIDNSDWCELIKEYKVFSGKVKEYEFTTEQMEEMGCSFPQYLEQIPIEFFN